MDKKSRDTNQPSFFKLFGRSIISLCIIILIIILINSIFYDLFSLTSKKMYEFVGAGLVTIGYFSTTFLLPFIPDDIFSATAILAGVNPYLIFLYAWLGSTLGASLAYCLGAKFRNHAIFQKLTSKASKEVNQQLNKYGFKAVGVIALTPLPDAPFSWMYGAYNLSFLKFIFIYIFCRGLKLAYTIYILYIALQGTK